MGCWHQHQLTMLQEGVQATIISKPSRALPSTIVADFFLRGAFRLER